MPKSKRSKGKAANKPTPIPKAPSRPVGRPPLRRGRSARDVTIGPTSTIADSDGDQRSSDSNSADSAVQSTERLLTLIRSEFQRLQQSTSHLPAPVLSLPLPIQPPPLPSTVPTAPATSGVLGALPPPSSLISLSVSLSPTNSGPVDTSVSLPSLPPITPLPVPSHGPCIAPSAPSGIQPASPQLGLILSPAANPIPHNLVQRIRSGQFVEMRDLLADNISLRNQLSSLHNTVALSQTVTSRTRLREIPSLTSWLYCFNAYVAVRTSDPIARDMLAYSRLLIREALRHGSSGWLEYDRVFRRQIAIDPSLSWNTIEPGLLAATIFGQGPAVGTFCSLCRECDHNSNQCALAPVQQQTLTPMNPNTIPRAPVNSRPLRRPETLLHICVSWNKGVCKRTSCTFRHICATCQLNHKARDCIDTPADSEYRQLTVTATNPSSALPLKRP